MYRIFLVEDHKVMADALVNVLSQRGNFTVTDVAQTAEDALERLPKAQADLALVDVVLPHTSGIELVSILREKYPSLPCLMISGRSARQYVERSLEAGARGYVLKDNIQEVIHGIRRVLEGDVYLSRELNDELV